MQENLLPYLSKLRNQEFKVAFERICSRLEGEEFAVEDVMQAYGSATAYINELKLLKSEHRPHRLSKQIASDRDQRQESLLSLKGRVTYFLKSPVTSEREAAKLLDFWLNGFGKSYSMPSINKQTGIVNDMFDSQTSSPAIQSAIETLGLMATLDAISSITNKMMAQHEVRESDKRSAILKAAEIRIVAYDKMKTLQTTIEMAIKLKKGDVDMHLEYLRIINFALADFKSLYLSSDTRRKNAAQEAEEEKENAEHENGTLADSTNGNGENMTEPNLVSRNGVSGHNVLPTQQAAMQSNTTNGGVVKTIPVNSNLEHDTTVKPKNVNAKQYFATGGSDRES